MEDSMELSIITEALELMDNNKRKAVIKCLNENVSDDILIATFNSWRNVIKTKDKCQKMLNKQINDDLNNRLSH